MKKSERAVFFVIIFLLFFNIAATESKAGSIPGFKKILIKKGDTLSSLFPKAFWNIICKVNRIDPQHLPSGKYILIPEDLEIAMDFCPVPKYYQETSAEKILVIFIDIQYFAAYQNGKLFLWGPISSGKKSHGTKLGRYKVLAKYRHYRSRKYNAEMPFAIMISSYGLFVHEQSLPGKPASHGCIRTLRKDAEQIFNWIKIGDPVLIK